MDFTGFHFKCCHADHVASGVADQIKRHPFHEELCLSLYVLLVQRVQHGVAGAVSGSACTFNRFFTVICGVAAKWTLVNRAIWVAVKRHTHVL